jgi:hypothetical protein
MHSYELDDLKTHTRILMTCPHLFVVPSGLIPDAYFGVQEFIAALQKTKFLHSSFASTKTYARHKNRALRIVIFWENRIRTRQRPTDIKKLNKKTFFGDFCPD